MAKVIARGNTIHFAFAFLDENGDPASVASAELQLEWVGRLGRQTSTTTLTESGDTWIATWDSTLARAGWVHYHAHAIAGEAGSSEYAQDGRFKLSANRASYQHDVLPAGSGLVDQLPADYV